MRGHTIYKATCTGETCSRVWTFVEHRGIAQSIVLAYLREHRCECGERYADVGIVVRRRRAD